MNLHSVLLERMEKIRDSYYKIHNEAEKRELVIQEIQSSIQDKAIKENFLHILSHYFSGEKLSLENLIGFLKMIVNNPVDNQAVLNEMENSFDSRFNTKTSTVFHQYELPEKVSVDRFEHAHKYVPSPVESVNQVLKALPAYGVRYEDFIFADIGSGMGRNLLLAAHFPFKKIMGIELSTYLHQQALSNVQKYQSDKICCNNFELLCIDANSFPFPQENMVLYLYEPFSTETAARFFNKLEAFMQGKNIKVVLVFLPKPYPVIKESKVFSLRSSIETAAMLVTLKGYFTYTIYSN